MTKDRERELLFHLMTMRSAAGATTTYADCLHFLAEHASDLRPVEQIEVVVTFPGLTDIPEGA